MQPEHPPQTEPRYNELFRRFDRIQKQIDRYIQDSSARLKKLEEKSAVQGERLSASGEVVATLQKHLERMETGLLQEFKISQEIMRGMIEHDMSIERAKQEFKIELEKKEAEILQQQRQAALEYEQQRREFRRQLYIKIGGIGVPIIVTLTTIINNYLERFL
jgi:uncharacterized coiled-coil protein SlyX